MRQKILDFVNSLKIEKAQTYKNLTIFPLIIDNGKKKIDYITLDEALENNLLEVKEKGVEGTVPEIIVNNKSDKKVLLIDGEELIGAKQNRIINTTILIDAKKEVVIPVTCTERGRWRYTTEEFVESPAISYVGLRAQKASQVALALEEVGEFRAEQSAVWHEVDRKIARLRVKSDTQALADVYKDYEKELKRYQEAFKVVANQIGLVCVINNKIVCADIFDNTHTLTQIFKKLIKSYSLDAIDKVEKKTRQSIDNEKIREFFAQLNDATYKVKKSVDLGEDVRINNKKVIGAALVYEDTILHLSLFEKHQKDIKGTIQRPSIRIRTRL